MKEELKKEEREYVKTAGNNGGWLILREGIAFNTH